MEKRTIVLDELLHHCSSEELNLLKKLIDKNLSGLNQTKNTTIKKSLAINNNTKIEPNKNLESSTVHFSPLKTNIIGTKGLGPNTLDNFCNVPINDYMENLNVKPYYHYLNNANSKSSININHNNSNISNNNERGFPSSSIPYSSQNSNETLINESSWASTIYRQGYTPSENLIHSFYPINTNYNAFYNYNTTIPTHNNVRTTNSIPTNNSHKEVKSLFDKLADELLINIFSYLDTQSLAYASQVNSRWYSLLRGKYLLIHIIYILNIIITILFLLCDI